MAKVSKTNVMRVLEQHNIDYRSYQFEKKDRYRSMTELPVFKTLVTVGKSKENYVFVVPVTSGLDLKKAAQAAGEKNIQMIKEKDLLPLTGYVHGGCSPIGMKKELKTFIDVSALEDETMIISAGKVGVSVGMDTKEISEIIPVQFVDIKIDEEVK